jgi:hypothetical protein
VGLPKTPIQIKQITTIRQHHIKMDFYRAHHKKYKPSRLILVAISQSILVGQEWDLD